MERPTDREDFRSFVLWWCEGAISDKTPGHIVSAFENNDPELLDKESPIWSAWWHHRFGQNPGSLVYSSSKSQTFTGPRGGIYKVTVSGRRYF